MSSSQSTTRLEVFPLTLSIKAVCTGSNDYARMWRLTVIDARYRRMVAVKVHWVVKTVKPAAMHCARWAYLLGLLTVIPCTLSARRSDLNRWSYNWRPELSRPLRPERVQRNSMMLNFGGNWMKDHMMWQQCGTW